MKRKKRGKRGKRRRGWTVQIWKSNSPLSQQNQKLCEPILKRRLRGVKWYLNCVIWWRNEEVSLNRFSDFFIATNFTINGFCHHSAGEAHSLINAWNRPCMCNDESWKSDNPICSFGPTPLFHHTMLVSVETSALRQLDGASEQMIHVAELGLRWKRQEQDLVPWF